jgi:transcriptional regulator with XRE-family HTH domain
MTDTRKQIIWSMPGAPIGNPLPNLRAVRKEKGMSHYDLAAESGYSPYHISKLETGCNGASGACAVALADALGVDVARIL